MSYGLTSAIDDAKNGKACLLVASSELSNKSLKEARFFCDKAKIKVLPLFQVDIDTLSNAVGHRCGILSVNDSGFSDAIIRATKSNQDFKEELLNDQ